MSDYERLQEKAAWAFEESNKILNDRSRWEELSSDSNATVYKMITDSGVGALRIECFFNKATEQSSEYVYREWKNLELRFGDMMDSMETIRTFEDDSYLRIEKTKTIGPVSGREAYIYCSKIQLDEHTFAVLGTSSPLEHPLTEGYVRPEISFTLQLFQPVSGDSSKTNMTIIDLVDPRGNIPLFVINSIITDRVDFYAKMVEHLKTL